MIKIRENVFETNSSSTHSVAVSSKDRGYSHEMPVDENGTLYIQLGEYNWGPDILYTPYDKLCYVMSYLSQNYSSVEEFAEDVDTGAINPIVEEIDCYLKGNCGVSNVVIKKVDNSWNDGLGYIDHQSVGSLYHEDMIDLIFNNSKIILIDNDNEIGFSNYDDSYEPWRDGLPVKEDEEKLFDDPDGVLKEVRGR